ncbi:MAG TPA: hypothetical protein VJ066_03680 [Candidatus Bathyarchaeia archaeon]|nr:hypothetical protein [Candidatus Bathyarchaeia archaeon]
MENIKRSVFSTKFAKKQTLTAITLILLLTFTALVAGMQSLTVQAAKDADIQSYSFLAVAPNPVGVNQPVLVNYWVADPLPSATEGIGQFRSGYKVTITKPDNTTETRGGNPDYLGGAHFSYTPTMLGQYTFHFVYPSETIYYQWDNINNKPLNPQNNFTQLGSDATEILTVQVDPVQAVFQVPYPTQYWTRPIYGQNYFWAQISSNWLMARWNSTSALFDNNAAFVPEGKMPNTAHILWTKPMSFGGLPGGIYGNVPYYSGMSYEEYFASSLLAGSGPAIIISGRLYYTTIAGGEPIWNGELGNLGTTCVDLYTGQTLFTIPNVTMTFGQILYFPGINQAGTHAYLWSAPAFGTWRMYDAWSGNLIASIANVTGGGFAGPSTFGPHGEIINYALVPGAGGVQLVKWNSTKVFNAYQPTGTGVSSADYSWRPYTKYGTVMDGNKGIEWQVPAVNDPAYTLLPMLIQDGYYDGNDILAAKFGGTSGATNVSSTVGWDIVAYDMTTGKQDYKSHIAPVPGMPNALDGIAAFNNVWEYNGRLYSFNHYTLKWVAYDIKTGNVMWVAPPLKNAYGYFGQASSLIEAYGLTIVGGFDGYAYGYNTTTGNVEWSYYAGSSGLLNPYGHFTFYNGITVVDGKVILLPNEHGSGVEPLYQNLTMTVLDAKTGKVAWNILGYFEQPIVADAIVLSHNNYDNQIYAFGKGPSATTVTASPKTLTSDSYALIEGSVTDQSPGAKDTPAISDKFMSTWMEYLYMQQANPSMNLPGDAGVPVTLTATGPDGKLITIGTTTSDCTGNFAITWTPPTEGLYTISANFLGTDSYWPSSAITHISVGKTAPSPSPVASTSQSSPPSTSPSAPTPPGEISPTELYLIAVAIIVIIVIIAAAVILRRRK